MAKLIELATVQLGKTPEQKAIAALAGRVEDAKMQAELDLHNAKKAVRAAEARVETLASEVNASVRDVLNANDALALAKSDVTAIEAVITERF